MDILRIVALDEAASKPSGHAQMMDVALRLSAPASPTWRRQFEAHWKARFHRLPRDVRATASHVWITCVPEELANGLLENLKAVAAEANAATQVARAKGRADREAAKAATIRQRATLAALARSLDFDS